MIESDIILTMARHARKDFPRMGANKLRVYLAPKFEQAGLHIGRDAFLNLLAYNHMLVKRSRSRRKTTFSHHRFYKYPNLIRDYSPTTPNQLWVSDITYIEVGYGFIYLSLITDAFSRKIVGWDLSRDLSSKNALKALKSALKTLSEGISLIHHSDRGIQYCSNAYVRELEKRNILISMTETGDPLENAIAERVNGILKTEWIDGKHLKSWEEAQSYVKRVIELYNNERPHQSISYLTPDEVHQTGVQTERKWKNYYQKKDEQAIFSDLLLTSTSQSLSGQTTNSSENVKPIQ